jgi:hypothetical protein
VFCSLELLKLLLLLLFLLFFDVVGGLVASVWVAAAGFLLIGTCTSLETAAAAATATATVSDLSGAQAGEWAEEEGEEATASGFKRLRG